MKIRKPVVAGIFYPKDKEELSKFIKDMMELSQVKRSSQINGLIVPHAGFVFSGLTATKAYAMLNKKYEKIIVFGPTHTVRTNTAFCDENSYWETPFGKVKTSCIQGIEKEKRAHENEHSIEVQLPFVQYLQGNDFTLIPVVIGNITDEDVKNIAKKVEKELDENTLLIISTDLSHFYDENVANKLDRKSIESIENLHKQNIDACGINPLKVFFEIAKSKNYKPKLIDYSNSADFSGEKTAVVGYASFIF